MLAIYMPIVRDAVATFVDAWNNHSIRKQNNRPEGVYGVPSKMYMVPDDNIINYGLWPDKDLLSELSNAHSHWGNISILSFGTSLTNITDRYR